MQNLLYLVCLTTAIDLLVMVPSAHSDWLVECGPCRCKWISGKKTADCKNTIITRIPNGLSAELQVLDVSNNYVPEIQSNEFVTANLRNLHKLFIRNATLKQIHRDSLKGLEILIELDLSYNLLQTLPRGLFNNLVKLRALELNNNKLERLDDGLFRNLKFLHKIELKENALVRIETKTFTNLPVLTQIYLDGNRLTVLRRECFHHLEKLTSLSLKQNPWNCTCELKAFCEFTFEQNLYTPPTDCYYPESLRGTLWNDVPADAFACRPKIVYPPIADDGTKAVAIVHASADSNVTMVCRMEAAPSTIVTWTFNRHALPTYPKRIFIKNSATKTTTMTGDDDGQEAIDRLTSELTILGVRKSDEGIYTCSAQNVGGQIERDIQLQIGRDANSLSNQMMIVLCLTAIALLIVSTVIMVVTFCYCRKFKNLIKHDLDEQHNGGGAGGTTSIGMDATANGNVKKHFQSVKLNSFNNATLIGNGSIIVGNTMVTTTTCGIDGRGGDNCGPGGGGGGSISGNNVDMAIVSNAQTNGSITIDGCDFEEHKSPTNEFIHANMIKSDMNAVDTHETNNKSIGPITDKKLVVASEKRLHYPLASSPLAHSMLASSPSSTATRHNGIGGEHQLLNQMQQQHQLLRHHPITSNARLPPDLLPYGQHQSLALKNSLNNSISSGGSSSGSSSCGGSTVIIDHRKFETYATSSSYEDDILDAMKSIANDVVDSGADDGRLYSSEKHLIRRPSDDDDDDDDDEEERDLRIYHHDLGATTMKSTASTSTAPKPFSLLGTSCTTTMTIATGKTTTLIPTHRFKNYELTSTLPSSSSTLTNSITSIHSTGHTRNYNYPFYNNNNNSQTSLMSAANSPLTAAASSHHPTSNNASMQSNLKTTESMSGHGHTATAISSCGNSSSNGSSSSGSGSNTSTANCKPRQSIVRTSPSFTFLSTGYHQQQDNFL